MIELAKVLERQHERREEGWRVVVCGRWVEKRRRNKRLFDVEEGFFGIWPFFLPVLAKLFHDPRNGDNCPLTLFLRLVKR